jgi:hypothetical protein
MLKPDDSMDTGDTGENSVRFRPVWKCQTCWVRKCCGIIVSNLRPGSYEGSSNSNLLVEFCSHFWMLPSVLIHYF